MAASSRGPAPGKPRATAKAPARKKRARRPSRLKPDEVVELFERLKWLNPKPTTELEFGSPYELLVAVTLSAQATDVGVNKATRRLFPVANTPQAIAALGVDGLKPYISTIGLYNTKAANVVAMAQQLIEHHDGEVPRERAALEALPGVGRKTANVVLNTAFGEPTMAVDTHIFRVSNRTGLAPGKTVRAVEDALLQVVPAAYLQDAHHWLILHGRYVCKARKPDCPQCAIRDICRYPDKTEGAPEH
ncbi:endonuclease III [Marilutibacter maris]|uniref:Endonuclease III n=1 Tax=Marilutibacter maris TaxID=1605891 RepID=A0A2U9T305_9GAMM|nr:endonuclease III [Lysobacter maris]AWV06883.1 endonuclease III [Lysobacter maris]